METNTEQLYSCIICSEFPEDALEIMKQRVDFTFTNALVKNGIRSQKVNDLTKRDLTANYGLLIEDDLRNVSDLIIQFAETEEIKEWVICKNIPVAREFLEKALKNPMIIAMDFSLEAHPVSETKKLYQQMKDKWEDVIIMGITHFEGSSDPMSKDLSRLMRSKGDSVYKKSEIMSALPNIIRDKLAIVELHQMLNTSKKENEALTATVDRMLATLPKESGKSYLVGKSLPMRIIFNELQKIRNVDDVRVLILGEAGTGKEEIAKAIHEDSPRGRNDLMFVKINCAEISTDAETAISKMFGHVKGAYTGATEERTGMFADAANGTIFLDEIGELPSEAQARLLRFLMDGYFTKLGDNTPHYANVRIISATNADLNELKRQGKFREDFYSRIGERIIKVPPLRDRKDDIPELAKHFLTDPILLKKTFGNNLIEFDADKDVLNKLKAFEFTTNVRQLKHLMVNAMIEARFSTEAIDKKILISKEDLEEAALKSDVKHTDANLQTDNEDDCSETKKFLDKIEQIVTTHFEAEAEVNQTSFLAYFSSTKTATLNMKRQAFSTDELSPRRNCIKKLLAMYPLSWPEARRKCRFIRTA